MTKLVGHSTNAGNFVLFSARRISRNARVCKVLPKPISSAKTPPK